MTLLCIENVADPPSLCFPETISKPRDREEGLPAQRLHFSHHRSIASKRRATSASQSRGCIPLLKTESCSESIGISTDLSYQTHVIVPRTQTSPLAGGRQEEDLEG
jgi:hypothetical protein